MSDVSSEIEEIEEELEFEESGEGGKSDDILNLPVDPLHVPLSPRPTSYDEKSSEDYSFSFDEEEAYSDDFEKDITKQSGEMSQALVQSPAPATKPAPGTIPLALDAPILPSLSTQSLAAEVLLQKLSKEVVHLRQQQREALKLKQQQAQEKKLRAAERRTKYNAELARLLESNESLAQEKSALEASLKSSQSLNISNESKLSSQAQTISQLEEAISVERSTQIHLREKISQLEREVGRLQEQHAVQTQTWQQRETALNKENMRLELQMTLVTKQCSDLEIRMKYERETLPQHHQSILDARLSEIKNYEARLHARESALCVKEEQYRMEYDRKLVAMAEEFDAQRSRLVSTIEAEKVALAESQQRLQLEKQQYHSSYAEQAAVLEAKQLSLKQLEAEIRAQEVQLDRERTEFTIAKRLVDPQLKEALQDREAANVLRKQAEKMLEEAAAREQGTQDLQTSLHDQETKSRQAMRECERLKKEYAMQRDRLLEERRFVAEALSTMKDERNKLQRCSVELFRNLHVLHNALLFMRAQGHTPVLAKGKVPGKFNTLSSMLQSLEKATSSMHKLTAVIDEPSPDIAVDETPIDSPEEIMLPPSQPLPLQLFEHPSSHRQITDQERGKCEEFAVNRSYYNMLGQGVDDSSAYKIDSDVENLKSFAMKYGIGFI